jgi:outer membrane cobalamin receptor
MIKALQKTGLVLVLTCLSLSIFAQGVIKGKIVDAEFNAMALMGATVVVEGTTIGTAANLDGSFSLKVPTEKVTLVFSYIGYIDLKMDVTIPASGERDLGIVALSPSTVGLDEIQVTTSFVRDRQTPVAVSTIEPYIIAEKLGTQEYPEILKSTPSVYATKQGGGYGDSRIYLRGFDSNNIGVLINGVPVNDMESGKVYWSNWAGLSDVTENMQVQRGLGASKMALSSVGGTINIITKSTEAEKGGSIYGAVGNDGTVKQNFTFSTGLLDNNWAVTLSGGRSYGDGYIQATNFNGYSYFVNISKIINEKHRLSFTAFGAPQWHNQRSNKHSIQTYRDNPAGIKYNSDYGYRNGEIYNIGYAYNYYHKPQISLNHYWKIDETTLLSTALYVSKSNGGGRRVYGPNSQWLGVNYNTGEDYIGVTKRTPEGLIDYDAVIAANAAAPNGSLAIIANGINSHDWYGILSSLTKDMAGLKFTGGFDGRFYRGYHAYEVEDLLGGKYFLNNSDVNRPVGTPLYKGDYINYHYLGEVLWAGLFGQAEYVTDQYSAFVSLSGANNSYRRVDYFTYTPEEGQASDWIKFWTYTAKGGANYNIDENHNVFVNGGYITRAPFFRYAFTGYTNEINTGAKNEKIITGELGYGYQSKVLNAKVNLYWTEWRDKGLTQSFNGETANIPGVNALHRGIEVEATYRPMDKLTMKGMFSIGDWKWTDDVSFELYDDNQVLQGTYSAYIADIHVGNSAQTTAYLNADYEVLPKLKVGIDYTYYGRNFSDFDATARTTPESIGDSWQLPDTHLFDLNARYNFKIGQLNATLYGNINNLFNAEYISDANDGPTHSSYDAIVWYGFGRTWSTGLKIKF